MEEFPDVDIGVIGEGEITFYELCYALKYKKPLSDINGLSFRKDNEIIVTSPRERILDQDSIPFPAWDLPFPVWESSFTAWDWGAGNFAGFHSLAISIWSSYFHSKVDACRSLLSERQFRAAIYIRSARVPEPGPASAAAAPPGSVFPFASGGTLIVASR